VLSAGLPAPVWLLVHVVARRRGRQAHRRIGWQGDKLLDVDGAAVAGLSAFAVESMLFGLVGSRVALTLARAEGGSKRVADGGSAERVFKVQLVRDYDKAMAAHDKLNIQRAMLQSAAQAWSHSIFSVIQEDERLAGLTLPELMVHATWRAPACLPCATPCAPEPRALGQP
jgi:hypothetical protein